MPFPLNKQQHIRLDIKPAYGLQASCLPGHRGATGFFIPYLYAIDTDGEKISGWAIYDRAGCAVRFFPGDYDV
jgi:hypothetical protein